MPGTYFALGDSMSIDAYAGGPGRGAASLLARVIGYDLRMLATDGADSDDVLRKQLDQVDAEPDLVTVTMGGNDLVQALFRDPASVGPAVQRVGRNAELILQALRSRSQPQTPIVVTTVYDPTDGTGDLSAIGLPTAHGDPRDLAALNNRLRAAAAHHGALVADAHAWFLGHGASVGDVRQTSPWPRDRQLWYSGTIEPNAWGAQAISELWRQTLGVR